MPPSQKRALPPPPHPPQSPVVVPTGLWLCRLTTCRDLLSAGIVIAADILGQWGRLVSRHLMIEAFYTNVFSLLLLLWFPLLLFALDFFGFNTVNNHNIFANYHSLQKQHIDVEVPYEIPLRQLNSGNVTKLWLMLTLIYASLSFCEKDLHKRNIFAYEWSCLMKIRRVMHSFETRRKLCRSKWWRISRIFETSLKLTRHPIKSNISFATRFCCFLSCLRVQAMKSPVHQTTFLNILWFRQEATHLIFFSHFFPGTCCYGLICFWPVSFSTFKCGRDVQT